MMSLLTSPGGIWLRSTLRGLGMTRPLRRLIGGRGGYEERVDAALLALIKPGDTVWDVGANIGHYTRRMAAAVGPTGRVIAIEPSPQNFKALVDNCADLAQVDYLQIGLSSTSGAMSFEQGQDTIGATSRILGKPAAPGTGLMVEVARGDDLIASGRAPAPQLIKIDVEGHELDVIAGLGAALASPALKNCVVEVHFGLLQQAARERAPAEIASALSRAGFAIRWLDLSHLHAARDR